MHTVNGGAGHIYPQKNDFYKSLFSDGLTEIAS
jgi:hypothetical protein